MTNPWGKFFWSDWETDPGLRLCSLAAQGLWMRMLCIAAKHEPAGYVAVAGRPLDAASLARMTGETQPEVEALLSELDQAGVFSRDRKNQCIFSRRMIRDAKLSEIRAKNGRKGAYVTNGKIEGKSGLPQQNRGKAVGKPPGKSPAPEARSQKERITDIPPELPRASKANEAGGIPPNLSAVMRAGRFTRPPQDHRLVEEWIAAGADLQCDIVPIVERITSETIGRTGRAPFKLRLFDEAVREAADQRRADVARYRQIASEYGATA